MANKVWTGHPKNRPLAISLVGYAATQQVHPGSRSQYDGDSYDAVLVALA